MEAIFAKYFQKSKLFLYPLIDMRKTYKYTPVETYVCWKNAYTLSDQKLLCEYKIKTSKAFYTFEKKYIHNNEYLEDAVYVNDNHIIYVYDFSKFNEEFIYFIKGQYSQFKDYYKEKINKFYKDKTKVNKHVDSYLYPFDYHAEYSKALGVDIELIINTHELCNKPDLEKETLQIDYPK